MRSLWTTVRSDPLAAALAAMTALCFFGYLATACLRVLLNYDHLFGLVPLFDLAAGWRLPAWYIGGLLGLAARLLWRTGASAPAGARRPWFVLAVVALVLGVDEVSRIHILLDPVVRASITPLARLSYGWMLPASAGMLLVLPQVWPAPAGLEPQARRRFGTGVALYLAGLLGAEALKSGYYATFHTSRDLGFAMLTALGGLGRMVGLMLVTCVLLRLERPNGPGVPVHIPNNA